MIRNHDEIEELLAGYVLRSLSGPDADEVDRLLSEHVPRCPRCHDALEGFQALAGELALAPTPLEPPELLLPRIRRSLDDIRVGRRRRVSLVVAAAGVAAVLGLGAWNVALGLRTSQVQERTNLVQDAITASLQPGASRVRLQDQASQSPAPMAEISAPSLEQIYLVGQAIPLPASGNVYRVWLGKGGRYTLAGQFVPDTELTVIRLTFDPSLFDQILISEEDAASPQEGPSGVARWGATL